MTPMCNCISEVTGLHEKFWWRIPPNCLKRNSRNCWPTPTSPSGADCPPWGRRRRRRRRKKVVSVQEKEGWGRIKREGKFRISILNGILFWGTLSLDFIMRKENWKYLWLFFFFRYRVKTYFYLSWNMEVDFPRKNWNQWSKWKG